MATVRERQEKEKLDKCADLIKRIAQNIVDDKTSYHDVDDIVHRVVPQIVESLSYISYVSTYKELTPSKKEVKPQDKKEAITREQPKDSLSDLSDPSNPISPLTRLTR